MENESHPDDCVDVLAKKVLSYRAYCNEVWDKADNTPDEDTEDDAQFFERSMVLLLPKDATRRAFSSLAAYVAQHVPADMDRRTQTYFWDIFPSSFLAITETPEPLSQVGPRNVTRDLYAYQAGLLARDLVDLKRMLLKPSGEWVEQQMFKKEHAYALDLQGNLLFKSEHAHFVQTHEVIINTRSSGGAERVLWADFLNYGTVCRAGLHSAEDQYEDDLVGLCKKFALDGLALCKPYAVPQRFRVYMDGNELVLRVPNFLSFDWKRDFPGDVVKMLQQRGGALTSVSPFIQGQASKPWYDPLKPEDLRSKLIEVAKEYWRDHRGLNMDNVLRKLHESCTHPALQYEWPSRSRLMRTALKAKGVPYMKSAVLQLIRPQ